MKDRPARMQRALREPAHLVRALRGPIQRYIHTEEVGAIVLLSAAAAALGWANSPWSESYVELWHTYISFDIHIFAISESLEHLVNEGLMAVFFFIVGLEIKRELLRGELSSMRRAALPVVAAIGGMVVPALIYVAINGTGEGAAGWGIPMATDIAFAMGVLALLGRRLPAELRIFLLGLAVVDDLGAIGVIAVFYTETIHWANLGLAMALFAVMAACLKLGVRSPGFHIIVAVVMWQFFLESGIHATLSGVMVAAIIPTESYLRRRDYAAAVEDLLHDFRLATESGEEEKAEAIVEQIERLSRGTEEPMERIERIVHPWVSFAVLPLFALANAGVVFTAETMQEAIESRITLGILLALPVGKAVGILGVTWAAVRLDLCSLPSRVTWAHVLGVASLAGIGFTVSIFISGIAFGDPSLADQAKLGVFSGSLIAGIVGYLLLRFVSSRSRETAPAAQVDRSGKG